MIVLAQPLERPPVVIKVANYQSDDAADVWLTENRLRKEGAVLTELGRRGCSVVWPAAPKANHTHKVMSDREQFLQEKLNKRFQDRFKAGIKPTLRDYMSIKIVAWVSDADGWAAYAGPADESDEDVAATGAKIPEECAVLLFPAFTKAGFRYRG